VDRDEDARFLNAVAVQNAVFERSISDTGVTHSTAI
jgi:hypothetical protein